MSDWGEGTALGMTFGGEEQGGRELRPGGGEKRAGQEHDGRPGDPREPGDGAHSRSQLAGWPRVRLPLYVNIVNESVALLSAEPVW